MFKIDGKIIRDELGRQRIFRGENICLKVVRFDEKWIDEEKETEYVSSLKNRGVTLVRLGFTWSMLEPEENKFDKKAFSYLKGLIKRLNDNDIYVVLDMHQDLFSHKIKCGGDGAPDWVTKEYKSGKPVAVWAEGYFYMRDVQRAFNDFWNNKDDVQKKFVRVWKKVIEELSQFDNVIAYDYFNEPLINDNANKLFCTVINNACMVGLGKSFKAEKYFEKNREKTGFILMALALLFKIRTVKRLKQFLNTLDDYDAFAKCFEGCSQYVESFNNKYYQPFIDKMINECSDNEHFNFIEHSYYSNLGIPFVIDTPENCVYSPHAYDVFIDSPMYNKYSSNERVKFIMDGIKDNQEKMNCPVVMGEWGGGADDGDDWIEHIDYVNSIIEDNLWSAIYWAYRSNNEKFVYEMNRPYPVAVCGDIIGYKTFSKTRTFELEYICKENTAKTIIYVTGKGMVEFDNKIGYNKITFEY